MNTPYPPGAGPPAPAQRQEWTYADGSPIVTQPPDPNDLTTEHINRVYLAAIHGEPLPAGASPNEQRLYADIRAEIQQGGDQIKEHVMPFDL